MTPEELLSKIQEWDSEYSPPAGENTAKYTDIYDNLRFFADGEWKNYLPAEHPDHSSRYIERLAAWIGSTDDEEEQKVLLEYALHINFFSHDDFTALYQAALEREVTQWIVQDFDNLFQCPDDCRSFGEKVERELHGHTWFCSVTESMDINAFCKVNNLRGIRYHPRFEDLHMLAKSDSVSNGNVKIIQEFMNDPTTQQQSKAGPLRRLVLLEDFVGTGGQCREVLMWALKSLACPILFVPLIITDQGLKNLTTLADSSEGRLQIRPVVIIARNDLLGPKQENNPWPFVTSLESIVSNHYDLAWKAEWICEFGFKNSGCSVVLQKNTPNNSVSLIHCTSKSNGWSALFPRVKKD